MADMNIQNGRSREVSNEMSKDRHKLLNRCQYISCNIDGENTSLCCSGLPEGKKSFLLTFLGNNQICSYQTIFHDVAEV